VPLKGHSLNHYSRLNSTVTVTQKEG